MGLLLIYENNLLNVYLSVFRHLYTRNHLSWLEISKKKKKEKERIHLKPPFSASQKNISEFISFPRQGNHTLYIHGFLYLFS